MCQRVINTLWAIQWLIYTTSAKTLSRRQLFLDGDLVVGCCPPPRVFTTLQEYRPWDPYATAHQSRYHNTHANHPTSRPPMVPLFLNGNLSCIPITVLENIPPPTKLQLRHSLFYSPEHFFFWSSSSRSQASILHVGYLFMLVRRFENKTKQNGENT